MTKESQRLAAANAGTAPWKKWGPYLSERQWGTVREDYSGDGKAWLYLPHEHARSRAYRWGEDGIGGICDEQQLLCLAFAFWNGRDPILKERLFGLTGYQGNHGEDVKEYYYYLDSTPTHSYMKMLYKYPQTTFPYEQLLAENGRRDKRDPEYELIDTGIFDDDRYFDVFIEYAKLEAEDILVRVRAYNRGPESAGLHLLPQIWFRNTWDWGRDERKPEIALDPESALRLHHPALGEMYLHRDGSPQMLFCDNRTNAPLLFGSKDAEGYYKDGIHEYLVYGRREAVNPAHTGSKAALHYHLDVPAGEAVEVRLRLSPQKQRRPFQKFAEMFSRRIAEADEFYEDLQRGMVDADARNVQRQAFAGMLWSKQFYYFDVTQWLEGDPAQPNPPTERWQGRNREWLHLNNADIISMPDKWEYPWYAAWDLAFHCLPLAVVDGAFAKEQLVLLTREWYMHPNGQLPAYEWSFSDVNPPVHAWAAWRVYKIDARMNGKADIAFLERVFHKLLLNFTWWVNRKDAGGNNIFQGGFLGLDNIGVFDRSAELPTGGHLEQADGTSWMAMYCLNMMRIAIELALEKPIYQDMATKFFEHFLYIAAAMTNIGGNEVNLWDDEDKFYYDVLNTPQGHLIPLKIRSLIGLIPLFAVEILEPETLDKLPEFKARLEWFLNYRPDLTELISRWNEPGAGERRLLSLLRGHRMKKLLKRMLDEAEFLSAHGVRALSKYHRDHPYTFHVNGDTLTVRYQPAESDTGMFGGNSNWRGPVWVPVNFLIIEALQRFHHYYGDDFKVEYPTASGQYRTLQEISDALSDRLCGIFLRDAHSRRPLFGTNEKFQTDPHFRDYLFFYEYFHGETGRGLGASHQTGWTGLIAKLLQPREDAHGAWGMGHGAKDKTQER